MVHSRAKICLEKTSEVNEFVSLLNSDGTADKYVLENFDATIRVNARSLLGVMYFSAEHATDGVYLVNETHDAVYPVGIHKFYN